MSRLVCACGLPRDNKSVSTMTLDRECEVRTLLPSPERFLVLVRSLVDRAQMIDFFFQVLEPLNQNLSHIERNTRSAQPSFDYFLLGAQFHASGRSHSSIPLRCPES